MSFAKKFSLTFLANLIMIVAGVLNYIVIVRTTGAQGQGLFTLVITSLTMAMVLLGGGALLETNRYLANKYKQKLHILFSTTLTFIFGIIVFLLLWWIFFRTFPFDFFMNKNLACFTLLTIPFFIIQEASKGMLWGLGKINKHNLINIFRYVSLLISNVIVLVFLQKTIEVAILGMLVTVVVGAIISILFVFKELGYFNFVLEKDLFLKLIKTGWRTFVISILFILSIRIDVYIIKFLSTTSEVGYYSVVALIANMVSISPMISGFLLFNRATDGSGKSIKDTAKLSRICIAYSLCVSLVLLLLGKHLIIFLLGEEFIKSYICLIYYLPALIFQNLFFVISMYICGSEGFPVFNILSIGISLIINIWLNLVLIPILGINGAAISASVAIVIKTIMNIYYFNLKAKLKLSQILFLKKQDLIDLTQKFGLRLT
ncbi:MAG: oligosaccharide flippase family protein [Candidatus Omnitrophica bacterium]|nr:oligosaccharide flippase family protein [Candidatus Omnitrophota bacterium]